MTDAPKNPTQSQSEGTRRVPRRIFRQEIGLLLHGEYSKCKALELGEGGMLITSDRELSKGVSVVVSVNVPSYTRFVVRSKIIYTIEDQKTGKTQYGLEFVDLDFNVKRFIRSFVAQATEEERQQAAA